MIAGRGDAGWAVNQSSVSAPPATAYFSDGSPDSFSARQPPPKKRLVQATGVVEVRRPKMDRGNDPRYNFGADPSRDEIIAQQGKGPTADLSVLHGGPWPEEESVEAFLAALHEWRGHRRAGPAA
jgi:hypothetical protein